MISGLDIVREQILVAAGEPLSISQDEVDLRGWSIECRINAENAAKKFAPAPGPIGPSYHEPSGPGVRVDSGVEAGGEVSPMYDPMVAKLVVWDVDREKATRRMLRALDEYDSGGLQTLIPFHKAILRTEQWAKGETCRDLMEDNEWLKSTAPEKVDAPEPSEEGAEIVTRDYKVEVSGKLFDVKVIGEAVAGAAAPAAGGGRKPPKRERAAGGGSAASSEALPSPLQGTILKVAVAEGAEVSEGDLICVIEAMKMENEITAHRSGKVTSLNVAEGAAIGSGDVIATIE
jgi:acetyl-CoA/propionyl-CoA carboxylase biotin carboxyl carrier protein